MKRKILVIIIGLLLFGMSVPASAQVSIGIRDSHYAYVSYSFKEHYSASFEQSLYAEKIPCQRFRLYLGYEGEVCGINFGVSPFYGHTYNSMYWDLGAFARASYSYRRLTVFGELNPVYDSGLGYKTCFAAGAGCHLRDALSLVAEYTTIPEYRMSENRLRAGLLFSFPRFEFRPMLSFPVSGNGRNKSMRVIFSFSYQL